MKHKSGNQEWSVKQNKCSYVMEKQHVGPPKFKKTMDKQFQTALHRRPEEACFGTGAGAIELLLPAEEVPQVPAGSAPLSPAASLLRTDLAFARVYKCAAGDFLPCWQSALLLNSRWLSRLRSDWWLDAW